jgi:hypothetical protein
LIPIVGLPVLVKCSFLFQIPVTIEDAGVYPDIKRALTELGFNPSDPGIKPKQI